MIGQGLLEGLGLGVLLVLVCAVGIRKGAVGMVHLYHADVQERCVELGLTTHEAIRKNSLRFKWHLHAGGYRLRADLRVRGQRRAGLSARLLAAARHFVSHERDRPVPHR